LFVLVYNFESGSIRAMKFYSIFAFIFAVLIAGCASSGPKTYSGPEGVTYHEEKDVQGVWMAEGFNFTAYDTVLVTDPRSDAESRGDEEKKVLETAKRGLRQELVSALQDTHVFQHVVTSTNDVPANAKLLLLDNNIYHHEKGGGGARYFAGLYGAGQPVIKVAGKMSSGGQPLFRYDMHRSGESAGSRLGGVFMSDESIQSEDIRDLARDLAAYIERSAKGLPAK